MNEHEFRQVRDRVEAQDGAAILSLMAIAAVAGLVGYLGYGIYTGDWTLSAFVQIRKLP